jgi:hypothetical protein
MPVSATTLSDRMHVSKELDEAGYLYPLSTRDG